MMPAKEGNIKHEELHVLREILINSFFQRGDLFAVQLEDGSYSSIKKRLQPRHLEAHLRGTLTLGTYILDQHHNGRFLVLDADTEPDWRRFTALSSALEEEEGASYLERSRRGGHLWIFFSAPLSGCDIRAFGSGLLAYFGIEQVELFPKQKKLTTGPGSLIRLPFGVHQKSGQRYGFYLSGGQVLAPTIREQIYALRAPETISKPLIEQFSRYSTESGEKEALAKPKKTRNHFYERDGELKISDQLKEAVSVRQFVLRYVELSPQGRGLCPFHDDHAPSFSVNNEENYWQCFACGIGGSIIDFWMYRKNCDYQKAIRDLSQMLL